MTCIAGIVQNGEVWLGGDSAGVSGYSVDILTTPKVFRRGRMAVGYTTSYRMGQVLRYDPAVPEPSRTAGVPWLVTEFVPAVRAAFAEAGFGAREGKSGDTGGQFLVGLNGRLYTIESDYSVLESARSYASVGAGAEYALGYLFGREPGALTVRQALYGALLAAATHCTAVRAPFEILEPK